MQAVIYGEMCIYGVVGKIDMNLVSLYRLVLHYGQHLLQKQPPMLLHELVKSVVPGYVQVCRHFFFALHHLSRKLAKLT